MPVLSIILNELLDIALTQSAILKTHTHTHKGYDYLNAKL